MVYPENLPKASRRGHKCSHFHGVTPPPSPPPKKYDIQKIGTIYLPRAACRKWSKKMSKNSTRSLRVLLVVHIYGARVCNYGIFLTSNRRESNR